MRHTRFGEGKRVAIALLCGLWLAAGPAWAQPAPAAPAARPTSPEGEAGQCEQPPSDCQKKEPENPWLKVPVIHPVPRAGNFVVLPTGEGYYSLSDFLHDNYRE